MGFITHTAQKKKSLHALYVLCVAGWRQDHGSKEHLPQMEPWLMYNVELPPQAHLPGPQKKDCFLLHPPVPRPIPSCRQADAELKFFSIEGIGTLGCGGQDPGID